MSRGAYLHNENTLGYFPEGGGEDSLWMQRASQCKIYHIGLSVRTFQEYTPYHPAEPGEVPGRLCTEGYNQCFIFKTNGKTSAVSITD